MLGGWRRGKTQDATQFWDIITSGAGSCCGASLEERPPCHGDLGTTERRDRGPEQGIPEAWSVLQSLHKHSYTQLRLKR